VLAGDEQRARDAERDLGDAGEVLDSHAAAMTAVVGAAAPALASHLPAAKPLKEGRALPDLEG